MFESAWFKEITITGSFNREFRFAGSGRTEEYMATTLLTAGIACIIAAIVGGGLNAFSIHIPVLTSVTRQRMLAAFGLVLFIGGIVAGYRMPTDDTVLTPRPASAEPQLRWVRGEQSPLAGGTGGDTRAVICPAGSAVVGLRGTTAEASTPSTDHGIEWIWDLQFTCAELTIERVSSIRYEVRTGRETVLTERIGGGGGRDTGPIECPANEIVTAFDAESRKRGFGDAEYLNYVVARCGRVALVYAASEWSVEIVTSTNLTPIGKAQLGGRRTGFSCGDGRANGDGVVTRIVAQAGALVDALAIGCSRAVVSAGD